MTEEEWRVCPRKRWKKGPAENLNNALYETIHRNIPRLLSFSPLSLKGNWRKRQDKRNTSEYNIITIVHNQKLSEWIMLEDIVTINR